MVRTLHSPTYSRWTLADSRWISAVHPPFFPIFFFGGYPAKFQPRVHLDSRPTIWTAWTPSHYTVNQPDSIWSPARVYNYCLFIIVIIRQGKKMP